MIFDEPTSALDFESSAKFLRETVKKRTCWQTKEKWLSVWYTYYINCRRSFFMMGKQSGQIQMVILDIDSMIPEDHLLRRIKNCVNFDFIYEKAAPYYSHIGRKSIDPVVLIKMLLIGYLYGIKSERRLEEEVSLNLAYRWFCGIDLMHRVPDHSTFSQNRRRRFQEAGIFREIFNEIVLKCIDLGIASGEIGVADGSFLPSNVS